MLCTIFEHKFYCKYTLQMSKKENLPATLLLRLWLSCKRGGNSVQCMLVHFLAGQSTVFDFFIICCDYFEFRWFGTLSAKFICNRKERTACCRTSGDFNYFAQVHSMWFKHCRNVTVSFTMSSFRDSFICCLFPNTFRRLLSCPVRSSVLTSGSQSFQISAEGNCVSAMANRVAEGLSDNALLETRSRLAVVLDSCVGCWKKFLFKLCEKLYLTLYGKRKNLHLEKW